MSTKPGTTPGETRFAEPEGDGAPEGYSPRKMTFGENLILTVKLLAGFALLGAALWGISIWKTAQ